MSDSDFVQSLARGIAVITAFSKEHPVLTLAEASRLTGLSRPTVRRILLTLRELGYVRSDGRGFEPTPRMLDLGYAYLSSLDLAAVARPEMERLVDATQESCSVSVLDDADIVYVARVPGRRIMTIALEIGSRLPAHATSMGRVLLAELDADDLERVLRTKPRGGMSPRKPIDRAALLDELERVRRQGWAVVDQELEVGVRSVAVPLRDGTGRAVAAMNLGTNASRISREDLHDRLLPLLRDAGERVSERLARR